MILLNFFCNTGEWIESHLMSVIVFPSFNVLCSCLPFREKNGIFMLSGLPFFIFMDYRSEHQGPLFFFLMFDGNW